MMRVVLCTIGLKEGKELAYRLLESQLCACVNMIERVKSYYWWDNTICEDEEALLVIKTTEEKVLELMEKIRSEHSYELAEIISLEVKEGEEKYLEWVKKVTSSG